jgi:hypothetical protein
MNNIIYTDEYEKSTVKETNTMTMNSSALRKFKESKNLAEAKNY